jgi:hypothetical protein
MVVPGVVVVGTVVAGEVVEGVVVAGTLVVGVAEVGIAPGATVPGWAPLAVVEVVVGLVVPPTRAEAGTEMPRGDLS